VLEDVLDEIRSTRAEAVVTVEGSIPRETVLANEMLDSVVRNVLKNAIQHNDEDVPAVTASATARRAGEGERQGDAVVVRIADNGPVPDGQKASIFGKGEKGLESAGTGIGLYLVRTLVDTYGGDVRVEDSDPEGAVFVVELPTAE
jgi:signal transduction histidine kinase